MHFGVLIPKIDMPLFDSVSPVRNWRYSGTLLRQYVQDAYGKRAEWKGERTYFFMFDMSFGRGKPGASHDVFRFSNRSRYCLHKNGKFELTGGCKNARLS